MTPTDLRARLIAMLTEDETTRLRLLKAGVLFGGYHPEMRAVHERNADQLAVVLAEQGWPGAARVGANAELAAWTIVQHAISRPALMRYAHQLLLAEAAAGRVGRTVVALLEDRIAYFEGRPQTYGSQLDWGEGGRLAPHPPVADMAKVDVLRAMVDLPPLAKHIAERQAEADAAGETGPRDLAAWRAQQDAFAREVGWR